ncbi:hypothetical protein [Helicobacter sp. 16-1353]|nr:hypothetical protein [Helicobacter sp. 16-1353]
MINFNLLDDMGGGLRKIPLGNLSLCHSCNTAILPQKILKIQSH